jgi:hypothetical protein
MAQPIAPAIPSTTHSSRRAYSSETSPLSPADPCAIGPAM